MDFLDALSRAIDEGTFVAATLSKRRSGTDEPAEKLALRPITVGGRPHVQFTRRVDGRETHENLGPPAAVERVRSLLGPVFEHGHLFTTAADYTARARAGGAIKVKRHAPTKRAAAVEHNRAKQYLIPEGVPVPFLVEIGVMTSEGTVRAAKYHKFRQINRFLELVNDVVPHLPADRPLHVVDFGCGKSYLTFALHHLLTNIHRREVRIVGLDRRADVIRHCSEVAERVGCPGLEFRIGDITAHTAGEKVDLAVALHACDTATDDALTKAVGWGADVILAVPCCQHELAAKMPDAVLSPLTEHGLLKERFAALATDALRAKLLEAYGYRTQVVEFIDMEHTAKNVLIRAVRRRETSEPDPETLAAYREFKESLGLGPVYLDEAFRLAQR